MAEVDWTKPIVACLSIERYPAKLLREGPPAWNNGERCFQVEIRGPHRLAAGDDFDEASQWWFNLDGTFCIENPQVEFVHIENGEIDFGFVDSMETRPTDMKRSIHHSHRGEGRNFVD